MVDGAFVNFIVWKQDQGRVKRFRVRARMMGAILWMLGRDSIPGVQLQRSYTGAALARS